MNLISFCKELIGIRSCTETHGTTEIVEYLAPILRDLGAEIQKQEVIVAGKPNLNLTATFGGGGNENEALIINTHLDTVATGDPALWTKCGGDPFNATIHDGEMYGLGTADTKLAMACAILAAKQILSPINEKRFRRPLRIVASAGEEVGLIGARHALESKFVRGKYALISEPSELNLVWAHKGLCACIIEFRAPRGSVASFSGFRRQDFLGEAAHSSTPHLGINALDMALDELAKLPTTSITDGALVGGSATNIIPANAQLYLRSDDSSATDTPAFPIPADVFRAALHFRGLLQSWLPELVGETFEDFSPPQATTSLTLAYGEADALFLIYDHRFIRPGAGERFATLMQKLADDTGKKFPQLHIKGHVERLNHPMFGDKKGFFLGEMRAIQKEIGLPGHLKTKAGCTEGALFAKHGMEAIVVGPGRAENNIHKPNEKVPVVQLENAVKMYEAVIKRVCL